MSLLTIIVFAMGILVVSQLFLGRRSRITGVLPVILVLTIGLNVGTGIIDSASSTMEETTSPSLFTDTSATQGHQCLIKVANEYCSNNYCTVHSVNDDKFTLKDGSNIKFFREEKERCEI